MSTITEEGREVLAPITRVYSRAGSRVADAIVDGESMTLRIPRGTRGAKVGAALRVRVLPYVEMTRTTISATRGTTEETYRIEGETSYRVEGIA